jgi:hypothetical protein
MLLIGAGGNGDGASLGGGSGAVTVWYGAAQNVPDSLVVTPDGSSAGLDTRVGFKNTSGTVVLLLTATSASTSTGGTATAANTFTSSGFYQSVAGQNGVSGDVPSSPTTFLSAGGTSVTVVANYGYVYSGTNPTGIFMLQPIIVGGGAQGAGKGGIGCGGGLNGKGGPGMVLIASW